MAGYVFDSHALFRFFQKEKGYEKVVALLQQGAQKAGWLHIMNFAEIIYITKKRFGESAKMRIIAAIHELGLEIEPASDPIVYQAAEIKGTYPLAFGDCFALATALKHKTPLVTGDPEFKTVRHLVDIIWV